MIQVPQTHQAFCFETMSGAGVKRRRFWWGEMGIPSFAQIKVCCVNLHLMMIDI